MTTLIGLNTNSVLESIIVIADRQISDDAEGTKGAITKLYSGKYWVIGDTGGNEREVTRFYHVLKGDKRYVQDVENPEENADTMIKEAIETGRFRKIDELNAELSRKARGDYADTAHSFIFAVNQPSPLLWLIDQWGNLIPPSDENDIDFICLGSGKEEAEKYIKNAVSKGNLIRDNVTTRAGIDTAIEALAEAESLDLRTGMGFDAYVITRYNIKDISRRIMKRMIDAGKEEREEIYSEYDKLEEEEAEKVEKDAGNKSAASNDEDTLVA